MCKFKVGDKVKTRDGRDVEIVCVDDRLAQPVVGLCYEHGSVYVEQWYKNGSHYATIENTNEDLIPPSRTVTLYRAVVLTSDGFYFTPSGLFRGLDDDELKAWDTGQYKVIRLLTEYPIEVES